MHVAAGFVEHLRISMNNRNPNPLKNKIKRWTSGQNEFEVTIREKNRIEEINGSYLYKSGHSRRISVFLLKIIKNTHTDYFCFDL
jgi:hypothetical protein